MEDSYYFDRFCNILSDEVILKTSTAYGVSRTLKTLLKEIQSEVLKKLFNLKEGKNDYLDYLINEVEKQDYIKEIHFKNIQKWLDEYNTTLEELEELDHSKPIAKVLDAHYNDMVPYSPEKDKAFLLQSDFLNYYCLTYANKLIMFLKSKKNTDSKKSNDMTNINIKPFKDEYLIAFCKEISDERAVKQNAFMQLYDNGITHFTPYLESEITENLLILDKDKKEDYLNYVIGKISKTPYANISEDIISQHIKEYGVDINEFPKFNNKELNIALKTYYQGMPHMTHQEQHNLLSIQIDFYCYACMLEAQKIIQFANSKKLTTDKTQANTKQSPNKAKQLSINQIVLLLQEIGFFTHPKIERASKVKQSELISLIVGLNDKNIKTAIQKLDKKPSELGVNYQKDIDKIDELLDKMV
ncbi:hypothetical protein [Mesoflavibacter zeaxanthinifaciens]|uniref:hypothetical protein n=1 Tax=Mesoflavibacter zeaxanthinifaciens TaxID=393060 RepID=UPI0026EE5A4A|nr:hypothetical protein [Mesoflavibacter zeaxanthinifaciens]